MCPSELRTTQTPLRDLPSTTGQRAYLAVSINCAKADRAQAQLCALFRSVLGVYVVDSRIEKGEIKVTFDIAIRDMEFTLHHLILDLPEAMIGRLEPKTFSQAA